MGTVPNPWLERDESDERAAETVVFGRGKSDTTAEVASSWYHSCISYGKEVVPQSTRFISFKGTLGTVGDTLGTVGDTLGTVGDTLGTVGDTLGTLGDTLGTVGDTLGTVHYADVPL